MDPVVAAAIVAALSATAGSLITLRATKETERTKSKAVESTYTIEGVKVQIDAWDRLVEDLRSEIDRLHAEQDYCRQHHERRRDAGHADGTESEG